MSLKRSPSKLLSFLIPSLLFISLSSGIIGGGGPVGFFSSVAGGERGVADLLVLLSLFSKRPNHPLARLDFFESETLLPPRLLGRPFPVLSFFSFPLVCPGFSSVRLNRRRMLPGRLDKVGEAGTSSARRLVPATEMLDELDLGDTASGFPSPSAFPFCSCPLLTSGVSGGVGAGFSSTGEGTGGGISVPSVREPNLKSRAGSSNRLAEVAPPGVEVVVLVCDGIVDAVKVQRSTNDRRSVGRARAVGVSKGVRSERRGWIETRVWRRSSRNRELSGR